MTNQRILTKAIQKAIDGGWSTIHPIRKRFISLWNDGMFQVSTVTDSGNAIAIQASIFNHDFAKALWHDEGKWLTRHYTPSGLQLSGQEVPYWKVHLQQMVISEDPIKYLGDNI